MHSFLDVLPIEITRSDGHGGGGNTIELPRGCEFDPLGMSDANPRVGVVVRRSGEPLGLLKGQQGNDGCFVSELAYRDCPLRTN